MYKEIKSLPGYQINEEGIVICPGGKKPRIKVINGYMSLMGVRSNGKYISKRFRLHRLVAETFIPNPENKPYVNHKDRNPLNNRVENLEWVTHAENMSHWTSIELGGEIVKKSNVIEMIRSLPEDFLAKDLISLIEGLPG